MADIAASDVTVTVLNRRRSGTNQRFNQVKIAFGNGTLTYPTGGIPLPTFPSFGFTKVLEDLVLSDADDATGIIWKYDRENKKLRAYIQGITVSAAGGATMDDFALDTTAQPLATAVAVSLTNNTGAGTKFLGTLVELVNTQAPPAATIYAMAIGQ